ncbi:MAG: MerR family transcriptional regulator [Elusimicrobia bacterium CG_4_10_14_0_8_um_filter_37_32]|nr:MAG: MerR family transcriptional regulator [Elusimicrobia bacterium CG02_land_8_20_14_3_00_37_13]PIZ13129.1 MAG: MerR family transcriptional regulator [Elusimicrobia bacterium CG_4_10_14_0_8_um_filter_37_32]
MKIVGMNIKKIRKEKGITLGKLGSILDVSASFLSQVEVGRATPSLATLKKIADALQTTIGALVGETSNSTEKSPVTRENKRKSLKNLNKSINMYLLTLQDPNKQMEPLLFKLKGNVNSGNSMYRNFGQEFAIVLKGIIEIVLNSGRHILKRGDSIYFNSNTFHFFKNGHKGITEVIWIVTPPTF